MTHVPNRSHCHMKWALLHYYSLSLEKTSPNAAGACPKASTSRCSQWPKQRMLTVFRRHRAGKHKDFVWEVWGVGGGGARIGLQPENSFVRRWMAWFYPQVRCWRPHTCRQVDWEEVWDTGIKTNHHCLSSSASSISRIVLYSINKEQILNCCSFKLLSKTIGWQSQ